MSSGIAVVKSVMSGDSVVLKHPSAKIEKVFTLAHLSAPRIGSRGSGSSDEPFAWDAREFLRKLLIGKQVRFNVLFHNAASKRDFGTLTIVDEADPEAADVSRRVVSAGYARVLESAQSSEEVDALLACEDVARSRKVGIYAPAAKSMQVASWGSFDANAMLAQLKGQKVPAVVEQVMDGAFLRVLLLGSSQMVLVRQTGIVCPSLHKEQQSSSEDASSSSTSSASAGLESMVAAQAKEFSEARILQRQVTLVLEGIDRNGTCLFASIVNPQGRPFAEALLSEGLARVQDWNMAMTQNAPVLRKAEKTAKDARKGLWKNWVEPPTEGGAVSAAASASSSAAGASSGAALDSSRLPSEFTGKVTEVLSGDTLILNNQLMVSLASVRAPRQEEPWAFEAKDFMRRLSVGKTVRLKVDYARALKEGQPPRPFVSAFLSSSANSSLGLAIVAEGLAQVMKHRDNRASNYDEMLFAEQEAVAAKKNMHKGPSDAPKHHINEVNQPQKARQFLPFLQRAKRQPAVVYHVINGARFKLYLPKESCIVIFGLEGVRAPAAGEPFGAESLAYAKENVLQRDVEVEVFSADPKGTFRGQMYVNNKLFAVTMLEEGFVRLHRPAVERSSVSADLLRAFERGKAVGKNLYTVPETAAEGEDDDAAAEGGVVYSKGENAIIVPSSPEALRVIVTEVCDGSTFYAQTQESSSTVDRIAAEIEALNSSHSLQRVPSVSNNLSCVARFRDGALYRARVIRADDRAATADVFFIDYGNSDVVSFQDVFSVPAGSLLATAPAQATRMHLAFIKAPELGTEMGEECADELAALSQGEGKVLTAQVQYRAAHGKEPYVMLLDYGRNVNINATLIFQGYATVARRTEPVFQPTVQALLAEQEKARQAHRNLFRYGDFEDEGDL